MAKNRSVTIHRSADANFAAESENLSKSSLFSKANGVRATVWMLAASLVYVAYWPHDSTEVPNGAARYLVAWLLAAASIASVSFPNPHRWDLWMDRVSWALAGWMAVSLVANSAQSNLRLGVNELGWWVALAASFCTCRKVASDPAVAKGMLRLVLALSLGVVVYGWHQKLVDFPKLIDDYRANPDAMLRQVGVVAEQGSAMRIVFENRLYDGGPTGTFALANSMAAMLVGSLLAMIGQAGSRWGQYRLGMRVVWVVTVALVGGMLLASRSRSAAIAFVIALTAMMIYRWLRSDSRFRTDLFLLARRHAVSLVIVLTMVVSIFAAIGYVWRSSEWIQQAPASLAVRFNYWRSCVEIVKSQPIFGVSPGQFKSHYESFRNEASTEQIADPHQFLLQTLTTGGVPALVLLIGLLMVSGSRWITSVAEDCNEPKSVGVTTRCESVLPGVLIGLAGVWVIGAGLGQMPMLEGALAATLAAVLFAVVLVRSDRHGEINGLGAIDRHGASEKDGRSLREVAGFAAIAIGVDQLASGGMTVPGVSLVACTFIAIAVPVGGGPDLVLSADGGSSPNRSFTPHDPSITRWIMPGFMAILFIGWYLVGIRPVEQVQSAMNRYQAAWAGGGIDKAIGALAEAEAADPWDVEPVMERANVLLTLSIADEKRRQVWEEQWSAAEKEVLRRMGVDAVYLRRLGDGRLIHYQRYGDRLSLESARDYFREAIRRSPSHEAYAAQLAEVLRELGDGEARAYASRALSLSQAGGYYERRLEFSMIYAAKKLGVEAATQPVRVTARVALAGLLAETKAP